MDDSFMGPPDVLVAEWEEDWHNSGPEHQDYAVFMATKGAQWRADLCEAQIDEAYRKGYGSAIMDYGFEECPQWRNAKHDYAQPSNEKTSMPKQHPITPPAELVAKLWKQAAGDGLDDAPIGEIFNHGVFLAYAAGADMEFEACQDWVADDISAPKAEELRYARRPKPPSPKERALKALGRRPGRGHAIMIDDARYDTVLAALEALPND